MIGEIKTPNAQEKVKNNQGTHGALQGDSCRFHGRKFVVFGQGAIGHDRGQQHRQRHHQRIEFGRVVPQKLQDDLTVDPLARKFIDEQPKGLNDEDKHQDQKNASQTFEIKSKNVPIENFHYSSI